MPTVRDILARKGTEIISISPAATVREAAGLMNERGIGSLIVLEGNALAGIFTERDVLRRVVAAGRDPATTPVRDVMTSTLLTCTATTTIEECAAIMSGRRIRHLPVVGEAGLDGVVTSGDVMALQLDEQASTIQQLNGYVYDVR